MPLLAAPVGPHKPAVLPSSNPTPNIEVEGIHAQYKECQEASATERGTTGPESVGQDLVAVAGAEGARVSGGGLGGRGSGLVQGSDPKLDKAGANKLIHPNKASRLKSRLSKAIKKAKAKTA